MARHDYDLPPDYEKRIEEGTMSEWYEEERVRRRAMKQDTLPRDNASWLRRAVQSVKRRVKARAETVDVRKYR